MLNPDACVNLLTFAIRAVSSHSDPEKATKVQCNAKVHVEVRGSKHAVLQLS